MKHASRLSRAREHGAATLVVVMVLFLVMALLAAYANRALLFEQRVSASYFRSNVAQEAAEAGIEWTLAQLNGMAVNAQCRPATTGGQRFADRYLQIDATERRLESTMGVTALDPVDCVRDAPDQGWTCRCLDPTVTHVDRSGADGTDMVPSFSVSLVDAARAGTVSLNVTGCSGSQPEACNSDAAPANMSKAQLARSQFRVLLGLVSAVRNPPAAPLVVKGNLQATGSDRLGLHNTDPRSAGMLAAVGGSVSGLLDDRLESVPGTSASQTVVESDDTLRDADVDKLFRMFMGTNVSRYPDHPAARKLTCSGDCSSALAAAYSAGQRIVWVSGNMTLSSNTTLGVANDPLLIVVNGAAQLTGPFQLNGMLVTTGNLNWTNTSTMPSLVNGIVLVGGALTTQGRVDIAYQQAIADQLRNRMGSYVRVPGSWMDVAQ
ncbi:PilX N-terminal domain-containing pilus assembly protein [Roseateles sp. DXS20W]|uniref:PilX N-terminal domain-containing pilus assembly protein n=1 Tax=Pelomonas lactea TaxID=3299030 RepID=A0ABW7GGT9_9BURK